MHPEHFSLRRAPDAAVLSNMLAGTKISQSPSAENREMEVSACRLPCYR